MLGKATVTPLSPVRAGQMGTWKITYTVGEFALDDTGAIIITR